MLDTHAFLWWVRKDPKLTANARDSIIAAKSVFFSAASAWEIATKHRIGKLHDADPLVGRLEIVCLEKGFLPLPVSVSHAEEAGTLAEIHKDPFDRMLIAQARLENLTLVSNETLFDRYHIRRLW